MKYKKIIFTFIFFIALLFLSNSKVFAGELNLKNLEYKVNLNSDGSANVTEIWDIIVEDTNTLFKTFEVDKSKYSEISNVSVIETTKGVRKNFSNINKEQYHVDKDYFYGLLNSKGKFEIAWGVSEDNSSNRRTFEISYKIIDAIKNYSDCSEFYWQFIGNNSDIPVSKLTGTIALPSQVTNIQDFRVWAHGPLNGNITKTSSNICYFEVSDLPSHTMLEIRITTPNNIFADNQNIINQNKLDNILSEENAFAEEANSIRRKIEQDKINRKIITIVFFAITNIVGIILAIFLIIKFKKYKKELENAPNITPTTPAKYFRDIPNENSSPADAGFLYYFKISSFAMHTSKVFSATFLSLCLKKYLNFEVNSDNKKDIKIILNTSNSNLPKLPSYEQDIFNMLKKISNTNEFTMKNFEKYCTKHSTEFNKVYDAISTYAMEHQKDIGNYDKDLISKYNKWSLKGAGFIFLTIISIFFMIVAVIPAIISAVYCFKISGKYNILTQKGTNEKEAWNGLKNYMEDFSMLDKREVPELILWEKYLVFATVFGIADKVLKQLKVVYPQVANLNTTDYTFLYFMYYSNMNRNFITSIDNSITSTYNTINYSSGTGAGGGFSGGGGGRWWWRPEWADAKINKNTS